MLAKTVKNAFRGRTLLRASASNVTTRTFMASAIRRDDEDQPPLDFEEIARVQLEDVEAAKERIRPRIPMTPLQFSTKLSQRLDNSIYLKMENLQMAGSYKERGALNKLMQLTDEEKKRGVVCCSAGNHAQAVAHWATQLGIRSVICMPENAPIVKVLATQRFGGQTHLEGESFDDAFEHAKRFEEDEGLTFVHAFNDRNVVAGQGTVALEVLEQLPLVDAVVVPIGGGGLIAGMALALKAINPRIKIYGVEAQAMPGMKASVDAGRLIKIPFTKTIADGIAIGNVGQIPFNIVKDSVDDIVTVDEDEIASAVLTLLEEEKTVVEGSGACALAALMNNRIPHMKNKKVALICTGGNIDVSVLGRIIDKGMASDGRIARIFINVPDIPGQLAKATQIIGSLRGNVKNVEHDRAFMKSPVGFTGIVIHTETKSHDHIQDILNKLRSEGIEASSLG